MARKYTFPVVITFTGTVDVKADNKAEAKAIVEKEFGAILDTAGDYGNSDGAITNWNISTHSDETKVVKST